MDKLNKLKSHWDHIYETKEMDEVSWYQAVPFTSLEMLKISNPSKSAKIIDVGAGNSLFVDHLIEEGFHDITVLDISEVALNKAKQRLGKKADAIKWINADATSFIPTEKYDIWHDRATFHFLRDKTEIASYLNTAHSSLNSSGILILGTFSEEGPEKCSGFEITQYSENSMNNTLQPLFDKLKCVKVDHITPSGSVQNFIFCCFRKKTY